MDIEFLFSSNPIVGGDQGNANSSQFTSIRPNFSRLVPIDESLELLDGACETRFEVPPEVGEQDHIAEVVGTGGSRAVVPVFRSRMSLTITESTGR